MSSAYTQGMPTVLVMRRMPREGVVEGERLALALAVAVALPLLLRE